MALRPIIAICGTTGVGKSNLAIEIAVQLSQAGRQTWNGAKIINADAMQVYAGMDVITNKVPLGERQGIEHLLMGYKSPKEQYVVGQWVKDALKAVDDAHKQNHIPIIVGGTSYWIQHLLFPNRLAKDPDSESDDTPPSPTSQPGMSEEVAQSIDSLPPDLRAIFNSLPDPAPSADVDPEGALALYNLLTALDASVAARWHWKDTRKVLRSIHIIRESGRKASDIIREQSQELLQPRFRTLCFWVYARPEILRLRLDLRVDKMMEQGLLDEVRALQAISKGASSSSANEGSRSENDYTFGIYQSIGYREFHKYLSSPNATEQAFQEALQNMKTSTRQYAKRQSSWLRNKLLPALYAANESNELEPSTFTYLLDATNLGESWNANVREPAITIANAFLDHQPLPDPTSLSDVAREVLDVERKNTDPSAVLNARRKIICPICTVNPAQPFMVEEGREWQLHQKTRVHRRRAHKPLSTAEIEERKRQGRRAKKEAARSSSEAGSDSDSVEVDIGSL